MAAEEAARTVVVATVGNAVVENAQVHLIARSRVLLVFLIDGINYCFVLKENNKCLMKNTCKTKSW